MDDIYPGSEFFHPGSLILGQKGKSVFLTQKKSYEALGNMIWKVYKGSRIRIFSHAGWDGNKSGMGKMMNNDLNMFNLPLLKPTVAHFLLLN
jgi:hypothetical protein